MCRFGIIPAVLLPALILLLESPASATNIPIPNNSFESPSVPLSDIASPFPDSWVTDGPVKTDEGGGFLVNLNVGIFPNTPAGSPDSIDNVDGAQAGYIGTQTGNEMSQLLTTPFQAGGSYHLTVAVAHSFGDAPAPTDEIRLALFYLDSSNVRHIVASTDVINDPATGLSANHFLDFSATSGTLAGNDPAVGQPIGVLLTTIGQPNGFFDVDNVRLVSTPEPASMSIAATGGLILLMRKRRP